jgi:hypothetical protein
MGAGPGEMIPSVFLDGGGKVSLDNTFVDDRSPDSRAWIMDDVADGKAIPFGRVNPTRQ